VPVSGDQSVEMGLTAKKQMIPKRTTKPATHTDLNREFESPKSAEWKWLFAALIAFMMISFLNLRSWG
jgi:hypothetical protein